MSEDDTLMTQALYTKYNGDFACYNLNRIKWCIVCANIYKQNKNHSKIFQCIQLSVFQQLDFITYYKFAILLTVVGGVMLPLVDSDVSGVVAQTVWGVDGNPDCAYGWYELPLSQVF